MTKSTFCDTSRRSFLVAGGMAAGAAFMRPMQLFGRGQMQDDAKHGRPFEEAVPQGDFLVPGGFKEAAEMKLAVQPLRRNITVLQGPGGNIAVLTGRDGKLLVDAEIVTARPHVMEALASINADPVKQLINTHWHFDHTGGNAWLHEAGANILAQENTKKHLLVDVRVEGWHHTFPASPAAAIPSTVFKEEYTVHANDSTLHLKHYAPAHTDSDISVHFAEADVFHTGDTFWNRNYPFIDYWTGGSIDGTIRAAEYNLAHITDKMLVIPGHGAVCGKADLILFRDVMAGIREKIATMKKQGRTLAEIVAAKPGAATDAEWGAGFIAPEPFVELVYHGV